MGPQHVGRGSIAGCFRKRIATAPMNAIPRTCLDMAGDSPGQTIAALSTTGHRLVLTENPGASARNWYGGMKPNGNGPGSTTPITIRKPLLMLLPTFTMDAV